MFESLLSLGNKPKGDVVFLGEVSTSALITGSTLSTTIGLTAGVAIDSGVPWLKWKVDGETVFYAKKPFRHTLSYNNIELAGAVKDTRTITIQGKQYLIGLPKGMNPDTAVPFTVGADVPSSHGSEWNRLMYIVSKELASSVLKKYSQTVPNQAEYDQDLDLRLTGGANASNSWTREIAPDNVNNRIQRGSRGVVDLWGSAATTAGVANSWRPRLQLIGDSPPAGIFLGEVPVSEMITGDALATLVGLSAGTAQFSNEPWLKFSIDGKIVYYAKKPFRHSISWDSLNSAGVTRDTRTISIRGKNYLIGLPKGMNPAMAALQDSSVLHISGNDTISSHNSEWNRLMYPITVSASKYSQAGPNQASYTESDLYMLSAAGYGARSLCRESALTPKPSNERIWRGESGVSYFESIVSTNAVFVYGWRPRLELVP